MPPRHRPSRRQAAGGLSIQWRTIRDLASRIAHCESFTLAELGAVGDSCCELAAQANQVGSMLWAHGDDKLAVDLFTVFGLALRRSADATGIDEGTRACYGNLRNILSCNLSALLRTAVGPDVSQRQLLLLGLILRTHVLRCYARLLLAATQLLKQRPSRRNVEAAAQALQGTLDLLWSLGLVGDIVRWDAEQPGEDGSPPLVETVVRSKRRFLQAMASELRASQLLDAWATCLLQLVACGEWSKSQAAHLLHEFADTVANLQRSREASGSEFVEPSPGLQYLMALHAVRLVVLLDGGTAYGLPEDAPQVPAFRRNGTLVCSNGGGIADGTLLGWALGLWFSQLDAPQPIGPLPPSSKKAMVDICIRIATAALDSWGAEHRTQRQPAGRVLLEASQCGMVTITALHVAMAAVRHNTMAQALPGHLRVLWDLYLRAMDAAVAATEDNAMRNPKSWWGVASLRPPPDTSPLLEGVPPGPSAVARTILSANGIVRCERFMWRSLGNLRLFGRGSTWIELMLFAPLGELAALVATAARCVRISVTAAQAASYGMGGPAHPATDGVQLLHRVLVQLDILFPLGPFCVLAPSLARGGAAGVSAGEGGGRLEGSGRCGSECRQLAILWSFAAIRLLPAVALGARHVWAFGPCAEIADEPYRYWGSSQDSPALTPFYWCDMLMAACLGQQLRSSAVDGESAPSAEAAGQWRTVLLQDVKLLELLGVAAQRLRGVSIPLEAKDREFGAAFRRTFRLACVTFPHELRAALTAEGGGRRSEGASRASAGGRPAGGSGRGADGGASLTLASVTAVLGPGGRLPDPFALAEVQRVAGPWQEPPLCTVTAVGPLVAACAALLVPPAEVRNLVAPYCCGNPACAALDWPGNLLQRQQKGKGCGGRVSYCCAECQAEH